MSNSTQKPKVVFAGAGPGDAELVSVKAANYLNKASFILVDRLVNQEIIERYSNREAKVIYVGKHGGQESISQEAINKLLVECGLKEGITVRLKGGDVAIFSQAFSEFEILNKYGIPFEIVPGITAASGASASLKVPLTARGYCKGVRFLTYYDREQIINLNWQDLAQTTDTLVFYMSGQSLPDLVGRLSRFLEKDKPLAVVEQATTPQERVITSSIFKFDKELNEKVINQPALVIIGDVLKLYNKPSQINQSTTSFFKEHIYAD